jgi:Plavaka transposase
LLTHCRRELMHAVWCELLDQEFVETYSKGVIVCCADGISRRIFPRIFTYSADYPEKYTLNDCLCTRLIWHSGHCLLLYGTKVIALVHAVKSPSPR